MAMTHPKRRKSSEASFHRQIRALNDNFHLGLRPSHPFERPGLYETLHQHFLGGRLERRLGRFYTEAQSLKITNTEDVQPGPRNRPRNKVPVRPEDQEKAALWHCLERVMNNENTPNPRQRTGKRASENSNEPAARKSRTMPRPSLGIGAIDSIPIRSNSPVKDSGPSLAPIPLKPPTAASSTYGGSTFSRSADSSRLSLASHASTAVPQETPASSLYSYDTKSHDYSYRMGTQEYEAVLNESFSVMEADNDANLDELSAGQTTPIPGGDIADDRSTISISTFSSGLDNSELEQLLRESVVVTDEDTHCNLRKRLMQTWPSLPDSFAGAPVAVLWELVRIAHHCNVDLGQVNIVYSDLWLDQHYMRRVLQAHPLFQARLPPACEERAWHAAVNEFTDEKKSVILAIDLTYNPAAEGPMFEAKLQPLHLRLSHRLDRHFGSDRFLEVNMPSPANKRQYETWMRKEPDVVDQIVKWLCRDAHCFLGRTWVPFFIKPTKKETKQSQDKDNFSGEEAPSQSIFLEQVYFFATNGDGFRSEPVGKPSERKKRQKPVKLSYHQLLQWAINIDNPQNMKQPLLKLFSRIALNLSRTFPATVLEKQQIFHRKHDITSTSTNAVMNDGIGRMSRSLARKIVKDLDLEHTPVAFQGRIGSAKGMWIVDVTDDELGDNMDWIETYPSQRKWHCDFDDEDHRTFEVRSWSKQLHSATLNAQFIPILEAQSRDPSHTRLIIGRHLQNSLNELVALKTAIEDPRETRLWLSRMARSAHSNSPREHVPFLGGLPDKAEDEVAFLLDSGFKPREMIRIRETLINVQQKKADRLRDKMNIKVPCSAYALMVVDFWGVLEEGEVHLSFSTEFKTEDGSFADTLLEDMDVLVARSPAHYRSDIQKVRVVSRPQLRKLKDVIVFSTKGESPLADMLSGGDYDGDIAWVCWDRNIVDNFHNAPPPQQPDFFKEGFLTKLKETTQEVFDSHQALGYESAYLEFLYRGMSFNMRKSLLGTCTKYKERLCYYYSVSCEQASLLSTLVSNLVDQSKQGIIFTEEEWKRFQTERLGRGKFEQVGYEQSTPSPQLQKKLEKEPQNTHVLDYLKFKVAGDYIDRTLKDLKSSVMSADIQPFDEQLVSFFNEYRSREAKAPKLKEVLKSLTDDINRLLERWKRDVRKEIHSKLQGEGYKAMVRELHAEWLDIKPLERHRTSRYLWPLRAKWMTQVVKEGDPDDTATSPDEGWTAPLSQWSMLKASATFKVCYKTGYKFAWQMAGLQLAVMKSTIASFSADLPTRAPVLVTPEMAVTMKPDGKMISTFADRRDAALDEVTEVDDSGTAIDDA